MEHTAGYGTEIREKEFTLKDEVAFLNHGSYGVVPKRVKESQKRYSFSGQLLEKK